MSADAGDVRRPIHPGEGRRRAVPFPKGRSVDPGALDEVRALLGDRPRRRDLLIEHLHLIQDHYHRLSAAHLAALAEEMRLSLAEVYEVATFYAHFDIVRDGEPGPPALTVRVCDSLTCALFGGERLRAELAERLGPDVRVVRAPCVGRCDAAPVAVVGQRADRARDGRVGRQRRRRGRSSIRSSPTIPVYDAYVAAGGYRLLDDCRAGRHDRDAIIATLDASGLRGLGGRGVPVGAEVEARPPGARAPPDGDQRRRGGARHVQGPLLPGARPAPVPRRDADRRLGRSRPSEVYIYLRDEYPQIRGILLREIARLEAAGLVGPRHASIHLRRGAGAYICGEESAMLESLEGKRGLPRHKPPFPSQVGLFGRPTLIHNVETVYWVRDDRRARPRLVQGRRAGTAARGCAASRSRAGSRSPASSSPRPGSRRAS